MRGALRAELTEAMVKNAPPEGAQDLLLLLAAIFLYQPHLSPFPDKALKVRYFQQLLCTFAHLMHECTCSIYIPDIAH